MFCEDNFLWVFNVLCYSHGLTPPDTTQDRWCDGVDKTVPSQGDIVSQFYVQQDEPDIDEDKSGDHHNGGAATLLAPLTLLVITFCALVLVQ